MPQLTKKQKVNAGEFIHQIEIQRLVSNDVNDEGIVVEEWVTLFNTRAKVYTAKNKEYLQTNVTEYDRIIKHFIFRTNRQLKAKAKDRILYDGEIYSITSVQDYDDKNILTFVIAYKVE